MNRLEVTLELANCTARAPERSERTLQWVGWGCLLEVTTPTDQYLKNVFSLDRIDSGKFYKKFHPPQVVRLINDPDSAQVHDLVAYGNSYDGLPDVVEAYALPRIINNLHEFMGDDWSQPDSVLSPLSRFFFSTIKAAVENPAGLDYSIEGSEYTFKNLGPIPLEQMGTPPFYPLRLGQSTEKLYL